MTPKVSIIIRTRNEEKYLGQVLDMLQKQTYTDFEILLVDNESTDKTLDIAKQHSAEVITIPEGDFTYPYASNLGVEHAKGEFLVYISGHSIPITETWLADGVQNFENSKVAGVYGHCYALPDANLFERVVYYLGSFYHRRGEISKLSKAKMGILAATNAIIRRDLWEQYHFNEAYAMGGEDGEWARHWIAEGYTVIHDPKFRVYHSHNLGLNGQIKQMRNWKRLAEPKQFEKQEYDAIHRHKKSV